MTHKLTLVSHHLCPYVQRAAISLAEKQVPFERRYIDLSDKPEWFMSISPLGKVPLLRVGGRVIFESAVILEYLEESQGHPLHPSDPLTRAEHRSWIEFGSAILNDIAGLYNAPDAPAFESKRAALAGKFERVERALGEGPWFAGGTFSLVDAVYGPIFRYFDVFEQTVDLRMFADMPAVRSWRGQLAARPSVANAVSADYPDRLTGFLRRRGSHISALLQASGTVEPA